MKNKKEHIVEPDVYLLPSSNDEMRQFIEKFRIDMMEHVVCNIKFAIENKLKIIEVFQFTDSPFVVTINENEFVPNLEHIKDYYKKNEIFELCPRIEKLQKILKNNEKEKPDNSRKPDKPEL